MTTHGESHKGWAKVLAPVAALMLASGLSFVMGDIRAQSASDTKWTEIAPDIQKLRSMPDPGQVVTKDQLSEIVRRLDQKTDQISDDVRYLREREEKRGH